MAAQAQGPETLQAQESVFAGLWRVLHLRAARCCATMPEGRRGAAGRDRWPPADGWCRAHRPAAGRPGAERARWIYESWRTSSSAGSRAHQRMCSTLTLLLLTGDDSLWLQNRLGEGRVVILLARLRHRRIVDTTWRALARDPLQRAGHDHPRHAEVGSVPEVACAAAQQGSGGSAERLAEVLEWVEKE